MKTLLIDGSHGAVSGTLNRALVTVARAAAHPDEVDVINSDTPSDEALELFLNTERVVVVSPIYWGRLPGKLECLLERIVLPRKAFNFVDVPLLTRWFGFKRSVGLTKIKEIHWFLSYGGPRLSMFGVPYFRLGTMISRLVLRIPKVRHYPTYLAESKLGGKNRARAIRNIFYLFYKGAK